ncbi:MAG: DUF6541 family protein [Eggerthellaceae bacterium]|nr:DUF6541 family protein [Eggerthellaceae bacterium]
MWFQFALTVVVALGVIIVPGYVVLRMFRFDRVRSLCLAAIISVAIWSLLGIALGAIGMLGVGPVFLFGTLIVLICLCVVAVRLRLSRIGQKLPTRDVGNAAAGNRSLMLLLLYILLSCIFMGLYFILPLDSATSFLQIGDNGTHMNFIAGMLDGGSLSALSVSQYGGVTSEHEMPTLHDASFYPNGWHIVVSLVTTICGFGIPLAENAVNYVFVSIVFPMSLFAFLSKISKNNAYIVLFGSVTACAGAAFPLRTLVVHQIYPNVAGFCCVLSVVVLGIIILDDLGLREKGIGKCLVLFLVSLVGLILLHPNTCFVAGVFLAAYTAFRFIPSEVDRLHLGNIWAIGIKSALALAVCAIAVGVWMLFLSASFMSSIVNYTWDWTIEPLEALVSLATLSLRLGTPQYPLSFLVIIGLLHCILRKRYRWLVAVYIAACLIFFCGATGDLAIKKIFTGFWYTDPERTAAIVTLTAIPIASFGLYGVYCLLNRLMHGRIAKRLGGKIKPSRRAVSNSSRDGIILAIALSFILGVLLYFPGSRFGLKPSALEATSSELEALSNKNTALFYDTDEDNFVKQVNSIIPAGSLVLNMPNDGSRFAYPIEGVNVYYKDGIAPGSSSETAESREIRLSLSRLAVDEEVRNAVVATGARYVLLLNDSTEKNYDSNAWDPEEWTGFAGLDDNPGFKTLLADGNMRLYEICL